MNSEQSGVFIIPPNPYTLLLRIVYTLSEYYISQNVVEVNKVRVHLDKNALSRTNRIALLIADFLPSLILSINSVSLVIIETFLPYRVEVNRY